MGFQGTNASLAIPRVAELQVTSDGSTELMFASVSNTLIRNTSTGVIPSVSIYTIQVTPQAAGKLVGVDANGDEFYLAGDATTNWPIKIPILVTYLMMVGDTLNLKYTGACKLSNLIITESPGIY